VSFYINGVLEVRCYIQAVDVLAGWTMRGDDEVDGYIVALAAAYDRPVDEVRGHVSEQVESRRVEDAAIYKHCNGGDL
jgi:hypothetical protein